MKKKIFDPGCTRCPRLAAYLAKARTEYPEYHAAPVAPFGDASARLLIVGLAPGFHGANASGRPFTGDHAGVLLYRCLHRFGFASLAESKGPDDGLKLRGCRITNAVKCVPPQNKPVGAEINTCNTYLAEELRGLPAAAVILALGTIAHKAVLRALGMRMNACAFGHGREHDLPGGLHLIDSYHCSRYNTQTRRLTEDMFADIFARTCQLLEQPEPS